MDQIFLVIKEPKRQNRSHFNIYIRLCVAKNASLAIRIVQAIDEDFADTMGPGGYYKKTRAVQHDLERANFAI